MKKNKTICLNMIVKNEAKVIERCLSSIKHLIDYWVIADTGSSDGTQEIIRKCMKEIPGELMERPWVDFSHNRNEVLVQSKGKGEYLLFIDADEWLQFSDAFQMPDFSKDCYVASVRVSSGAVYQRVLLINNEIPWEWRGVLHEDICPQKINGYEFLQGVINVSNTEEGNRSRDPLKYQRDAEVLEKALQKKPDDPRYTYYLAQSYEEGQEYEKALAMFEKRTKLGGWEEEIFYSHFKMGHLKRRLHSSPEEFILHYAEAHQFRPSRGEPVFHLIDYYLTDGENPLMAYLLAGLGKELPKSKDCMLVEHAVYDYGFLLQYAESAERLGQYDEAYGAYKKILSVPSLVEELKKWILKRLPFLEARKMTASW